MKGSLIRAMSLCSSNILLACEGQQWHIGGHSLVSSFLKGVQKLHPLIATGTPAWGLPLMLDALCRPPYEPLAQSELKWVTCKTAFLLATSSVKCVSELHALSIGPSCLRWKLNGSGFTQCGRTQYFSLKTSGKSHHSIPH